MELFRIRKDIPFMRHALVLNVISFVTFAAAVFFIFTRGLYLSIEFTGGTVLEVEYAQPADINKTRSAVESLAREFAGRPDTLLVVCGGEESGSDEAWSRAQGAFVHIPGVSSGDSLVSLFIEARVVSERRSAAESLGQVGSTHTVGARG
jgi:hypothetical protein